MARAVHRVLPVWLELMAGMVRMVLTAQMALPVAMALTERPMRVMAVTVATVPRHWMLQPTEAMVALVVLVVTPVT